MSFNEKDLTISPASFEEAMDLQDAIGKALKGTKLELPEDTTADLSPDSFGDIIGAALGVATSKEVRNALFACSARAVYGPAKEKVDRDFFEKEENRGLYYPIMVEVIKKDIGPFIKGLALKFGALDLLKGNNPK